MNNSLQKEIDEFIAAFLEQENVKKYFILEKQINNSKEIASLQENLKQAQKRLALSITNKEEYEKNKRIYLDLKDEFDNNPLITNYNLLKEEIYASLEELKERLK